MVRGFAEVVPESLALLGLSLLQVPDLSLAGKLK